jgi:hypothetical protein
MGTLQAHELASTLGGFIVAGAIIVAIAIVAAAFILRRRA